MEINSISSAFASAAGVEETDEQKETTKAQEEKSKEESVKAKKREEKDTVDISTTSDYDEDDVEEKAANYIQNLQFVGNLTEESKAALQEYLRTFDASKFIKMYGPFTSTSEVTAAMYAATSGLIRKQEDE